MDNNKRFDSAVILATGQQTIFAEAEALTQLGQRLGADFIEAAKADYNVPEDDVDFDISDMAAVDMQGYKFVEVNE